ncbi:hypothetical protein [Paenibacillus taichungensis]|uniref:hypothetical protein n=1 Tax=Paenibacillus taichungensis TaxID=484184 RepID=UPI00399F24A3
MSTKEIGLPVSLSQGTYINTEYKNGKLQLKEVTKDSSGNPTYQPQGTWESSVISIGDQVTAFERVVKNLSTAGKNAKYRIYTKSSQNNVNWSDYVEINYNDSSINSPVGLYAQVKIELSTALSPTVFKVDDFIDGKYDTEYVSSATGSLKLKRNIALTSAIESNADGFLYRTRIDRKEFNKINTLVFQ